MPDGDPKPMYTECPACGTMFGVGAADLRAARGKVRCGSCLAVFDALERLSEGTPPERAAAPPSDPEADGSATVAVADESAHAQAASSRHVPVLDLGGPPALDPPRPRPVPEEAEPAGPVPEILREDLARFERARGAARSRLVLGALAALLVAALGVQIAWFDPGATLASYPQARAALAWFCERSGCAMPKQRAPERVQMVSRDVRVHPKYEGALRISATIVNAAEFRQPFPRMQFTLFNVNGQTIASRVFAPRDYLPTDVDAATQMRPRVPLQIALDVLAPEEVAVSFEFRFL